jgi:hypothetical protein
VHRRVSGCVLTAGCSMPLQTNDHGVKWTELRQGREVLVSTDIIGVSAPSGRAGEGVRATLYKGSDTVGAKRAAARQLPIRGRFVAKVATAPPSCSTVVGSAGGARSGFCARVLTLAYVLRRPRDGPGVARWRGGGVLLLPRSHAPPPALPPTPRSLWACRSAVADCCVCLMCRQHDGARYQPGAIVA